LRAALASVERLRAGLVITYDPEPDPLVETWGPRLGPELAHPSGPRLLLNLGDQHRPYTRVPEAGIDGNVLQEMAAVRKLQGGASKGSTVETTRFKGLGEISPKEFKQFIGPDIRLRSVTLDSLSEVSKVLSFYMGKNTPMRRKYIMDHLILTN